MNPEQISGIIRAIVSPAVVWLSARGLFPAGWVADTVAITAVVVTSIWSYYSNSTSQQVKNVAKNSGVVEIVTTPGTVPLSIPKVKVTPPLT